MMPTENKYQLPRTLMARTVFGALLLLLVYFYFTHSLVHQWEQPPLIYPEADNTYWLLHLLGIPQWIMRSAIVSLCFDGVLFVSVLLFFIFPKRIVFCVVAIVCLWLFQIMYGSANGHHYHHIGFLLLPLPFVFRSPMRFYFTWQLVRYWILFLFVCAGLYKLYYGGFFAEGNMAEILKQGLTGTNTWSERIGFFLVDHPALAQWLYRLAALLQMALAVGFFTRRYDGWLLVLLLVFNLANVLVMGISFWDNCLVLTPFLPWERLNLQYPATSVPSPEAK